MNNVIVGSNKGSRIFIGTKEMFKVIYHAGSGEIVKPEPGPDEPVVTAPEVWYGQFSSFGAGYLSKTPETYAKGFHPVIWERLHDGNDVNGELVSYKLKDWKKLDGQEYLMTGKTMRYFMAVRKDLLPEGKKLSDFVKIQALGVFDYEDPDPTIVEVTQTQDGTNDINMNGTIYNFVSDYYAGWNSTEPQRVRFVITTDF